MRCNNCEAELLFVDRGGVRGLALIPRADGPVPYSIPSQVSEPKRHFDAEELIARRGREVLGELRRARRAWRTAFSVTAAGAMVSITGMLCTLFAAAESAGRHADWIPGLFLAATGLAPILFFVALYFHQRMQLAGEKIRRVQDQSFTRRSTPR